MNFLINGYFGYANAGDEAVLAAMLAHLRVLDSSATFTATSGDAAQTRKMHGIDAIGRQNPRDLLAAIRKCDVFLSGGGSLVQDVTSVRNAVYYTTLLRTAKTLGKPTMVYAQGVGPLNTPTARKVARSAFQGAKVVTVRDPDSAQLLREIGVTRAVEITADPVWDLASANDAPSPSGEWIAALRTWPSHSEDAVKRLVIAIKAEARAKGKTLRFLAMQTGVDDVLIRSLVHPDEILDTRDLHPREIIARMAGAEKVLAMRLHALIFAASVGVPVVAFDYDPKVKALANIIGAPLVASPSESDLQSLPQLIEEAKAPSTTALETLKSKARRNAELAAKLK
ncbi:polysaccharide pyruvyl transferase CsaB [bacterium]|nr:MAG: polysaccharide pyruvyl transferase CsaB [bacterium]